MSFPRGIHFGGVLNQSTAMMATANGVNIQPEFHRVRVFDKVYRELSELHSTKIIEGLPNANLALNMLPNVTSYSIGKTRKFAIGNGTNCT